eukprot:scaffold7376_cov250-Pinguiococcus_pyrenoidosus.AAC.6
MPCFSASSIISCVGFLQSICLGFDALPFSCSVTASSITRWTSAARSSSPLSSSRRARQSSWQSLSGELALWVPLTQVFLDSLCFAKLGLEGSRVARGFAVCSSASLNFVHVLLPIDLSSLKEPAKDNLVAALLLLQGRAQLVVRLANCRVGGGSPVGAFKILRQWNHNSESQGQRCDQAARRPHLQSQTEVGSASRHGGRTGSGATIQGFRVLGIELQRVVGGMDGLLNASS